MSEYFVSIGKKGGERKHFHVVSGSWENISDEIAIAERVELELLTQEVRKMPQSLKVTFAIAAATMVIDSLFGGGAITAAAGVADITTAFDPVKELLIAIADPICYIMFVWGCIECIVGRAATGLNRMKYAAIGYIAINWIPVIMDVIREAGAAGRGA